jgi:hypothetical protein
MIHREAKEATSLFPDAIALQVQPVLQNAVQRRNDSIIFFAKSTILHMASSGMVPFSWNTLLVEHADDRIQSK